MIVVGSRDVGFINNAQQIQECGKMETRRAVVIRATHRDWPCTGFSHPRSTKVARFLKYEAQQSAVRRTVLYKVQCSEIFCWSVDGLGSGQEVCNLRTRRGLFLRRVCPMFSVCCPIRSDKTLLADSMLEGLGAASGMVTRLKLEISHRVVENSL